MSNPIFASVPGEGQNPFTIVTPEELKTSPASQAEKKEESEGNVDKPEVKQPKVDKKPNDDDDSIPFHKHPRWKARQQEIEELRLKNEALENRINQISTSKVKEEPEVPDWWKKSYGEDEQSLANYKAYQRSNEDFEQRVEEKVMSKIRQQQEAEAEAVRKANQYLEQQFEELVDSGAEVDKNALFKFILDTETKYQISFRDSKGNYDLTKAYTMMQDLQPTKETKTTQTVDRKKELASNSTSSKPVTGKDSIPVISRGDLRSGNWQNIIRNR